MIIADSSKCNEIYLYTVRLSILIEGNGYLLYTLFPVAFPCPDTFFSCALWTNRKRCVPLYFRLDGYKDCRDGSDEGLGLLTGMCFGLTMIIT